MKESRVVAALSVMALALSACASGPAVRGAGTTAATQVKNVIVLLSDGTVNEAWPLALAGVRGGCCVSVK